MDTQRSAPASASDAATLAWHSHIHLRRSLGRLCSLTSVDPHCRLVGLTVVNKGIFLSNKSRIRRPSRVLVNQASGYSGSRYEGYYLVN